MDAHGFVTETCHQSTDLLLVSSHNTVHLAQILNRAKAMPHKHSFFFFLPVASIVVMDTLIY